MHTPDQACRYYIWDDFFCRLVGPVAPTGKAIVHWIEVLTYKNLIYLLNLQFYSYTTLLSNLFIVFGSKLQREKPNHFLPVDILCYFIPPVDAIRNLGVWFDSDFSFSCYEGLQGLVCSCQGS